MQSHVVFLICSIFRYDYSIQHVILHRNNLVEDLGFIFTPTRSFRPHFDTMVGKALHNLRFIRLHAGSILLGRRLLILLVRSYKSAGEGGDCSHYPLKSPQPRLWSTNQIIRLLTVLGRCRMCVVTPDRHSRVPTVTGDN